MVLNAGVVSPPWSRWRTGYGITLLYHHIERYIRDDRVQVARAVSLSTFQGDKGGVVVAVSVSDGI